METTKFAGLKEKFLDIKREMMREGEALLKETFQAAFDANPSLYAIVWYQYTPYFNDGDPCTFSINEPYLLLNAGPDDLEHFEGSEYVGDNPLVETLGLDYIRYAIKGWPEWWSGSTDKEIWDGLDLAPLAELRELFDDKEMEDIFLQAFDDHAVVKATREGFAVEEFQHE